MPLSMFADRTRPPPYPVLLMVSCDGGHGLIIDPPTVTFDATNGHPRDAAIAAGWVFTKDGLVLCPDCGRRARGAPVRRRRR